MKNNDEKPKKVVFLDMDGVVNRLGVPCEAGDSQYIDKQLYVRLQQIIERTGAKVVLSSSWKDFPDYYNFLKDFFRCDDIEIIDKTPALASGRSSEIRRWLEENEGVDRYAVLDDFDLSDGLPKSVLVRTLHVIDDGVDRRVTTGLTDDDVDRAVHILNGCEQDLAQMTMAI